MSVCATTESHGHGATVLRAVPPLRSSVTSAPHQTATPFQQLDAHLARWGSRIDQMLRVATALGDEAARLSDTMASSTHTAQRILDAHAGRFESSLTPMTCWVSMAPELDEGILQLLELVDALDEACAAAHTQLSQARRNARLLSAERAERGATGGTADEDAELVQQACEAARTVGRVRELATAVARLSVEIEGLFDLPAGLLQGWRSHSSRMDAGLAERLQVEVQLTQLDAEALAGKGRRCLSINLDDEQSVQRFLRAVA